MEDMTRTYFHVPGVGRGAIAGFGCKVASTHNFAEMSVFQVGEARTFRVGFGHPHIPQTKFLCTKLQLFQTWEWRPAGVVVTERGHVAMKVVLGRDALLLDELRQLRVHLLHHRPLFFQSKRHVCKKARMIFGRRIA